MNNNIFSNLDFEKYLRIITILLFTESITLLFLSFPSILLTQTYQVVSFYFLFTIYAIISLLVPWFYVFFTNSPKIYFNIILTSLICFSGYLLLNFVVKLPIIVLIYFIILKSFITGLAALFKIFYRIIVDGNLFGKKRVSKSHFIEHEGLQIAVKEKIEKDLEKYDLIGCFILLFVYPLSIMMITYFIFTVV